MSNHQDWRRVRREGIVPNNTFLYILQELQTKLVTVERERDTARHEARELKKNQHQDQINLMQSKKKLQNIKKLFDDNISIVIQIWKDSDKKEEHLKSENRQSKLQAKRETRDQLQTEHLLKCANEKIQEQEWEIIHKELEIQEIKEKMESLRSQVDKMEKELSGEESLSNQLECALHELRANKDHITQVHNNPIRC